MKSKIAHDIKHRVSPNDEFETPVLLAKKLYELVSISSGDVVMDNAYGGGNFYQESDLYSTDFFNDDRAVDWYITNPPYSKIDEWLKKSCSAKKGFAYLLGLHNLTPKRIEACEKMGFGITKIFLCKVFKWFGISAFVIWGRGAKGIIEYDRIVWKYDNR
jgi:hypothetical protein